MSFDPSKPMTRAVALGWLVVLFLFSALLSAGIAALMWVFSLTVLHILGR